MSELLSSGNLESLSGCTVGNYVIEWRLDNENGDIVFVSASSDEIDTGIKAVHPFKNEVVQSGTLKPVIRFCELNNIKYSAKPMVGAKLSPDFETCLPPVIVDNWNCESIYNPTTNYKFNLIFQRNNFSVDDKIRDYKYYFNLNTKYIGFIFSPDDIVDEIKIRYCTQLNPEGILIENFLAGVEVLNANDFTTTEIQNVFNPSNYPIEPKRVNKRYETDVKNIIDLDSVALNNGFTRSSNDYLHIYINGAYNNPDFNETYWLNGLQCIDNINEATDYSENVKLDLNSLSPESLKYNENTCAFRFEYENTNFIGAYDKESYFHVSTFSHVESSTLSPLQPVGGSIYTTKKFGFNVKLVTEYNLSYTQTITKPNYIDYSKITVNNTLGNIEIIFESLDTYNYYVDWLQTYTNNIYNNYFVNDPTKKNYYTNLRLGFFKNGMNCGDDKTQQYYRIHPLSFSQINYGNTTNKTINIPLTQITNGFNNLPCDGGLYSDINSIVNQINTAYSDVHTFDSYCFDTTNKAIKYISGIYIYPIVQNFTKIGWLGKEFSTYINDIYDLTNKGFVNVGNYYVLFFGYYRLTITADFTSLGGYDNSNSTHRQMVLDNWKLEINNTLINGIYTTSSFTKIYEVENGVEIYKQSPY